MAALPKTGDNIGVERSPAVCHRHFLLRPAGSAAPAARQLSSVQTVLADVFMNQGLGRAFIF